MKLREQKTLLLLNHGFAHVTPACFTGSEEPSPCFVGFRHFRQAPLVGKGQRHGLPRARFLRVQKKTTAFNRKLKITSTSTERQKRSQKLAPVLVKISGNSLVFSRKMITRIGVYRCCALGAHPEGPARQIDVSRQKLSPHCLEAIFDSQLPSPKLSPKMPPKLSLPHKRGLFILFQN